MDGLGTRSWKNDPENTGVLCFIIVFYYCVSLINIFFSFFMTAPTLPQAAKTQEMDESSHGATRFMPALQSPLGRWGQHRITGARMHTHSGPVGRRRSEKRLPIQSPGEACGHWDYRIHCQDCFMSCPEACQWSVREFLIRCAQMLSTWSCWPGNPPPANAIEREKWLDLPTLLLFQETGGGGWLTVEQPYRESSPYSCPRSIPHSHTTAPYGCGLKNLN